MNPLLGQDCFMSSDNDMKQCCSHNGAHCIFFILCIFFLDHHLWSKINCHAVNCKSICSCSLALIHCLFNMTVI